MLKRIVSGLVLLLCFLILKTPDVFGFTSIEVLRTIPIKRLPSLSGVEYRRGSFFTICASEPVVYRMDSTYKIVEKINLAKSFYKGAKADFEALSLSKWKGEHFIMVLGSGFKSGKADLAYIYSMEKKETKSVKLTRFYRELKKAARKKRTDEINIKGIASTGKMVYLLNSGDRSFNAIFEISEDQFIEYFFKRNKEMPRVKTYHLKLPDIMGVEASLTGASYLSRENSLIISASVVDRKQPNAKGIVMGSFIGFLSLKDIKSGKNIKSNFSILTYQNHIMPIKVESVVATIHYQNTIRATLVGDDNNGRSDLIKVSIIP